MTLVLNVWLRRILERDFVPKAARFIFPPIKEVILLVDERIVGGLNAGRCIDGSNAVKHHINDRVTYRVINLSRPNPVEVGDGVWSEVFVELLGKRLVGYCIHRID